MAIVKPNNLTTILPNGKVSGPQLFAAPLYLFVGRYFEI